jgi:hypothetical protein
VGEKRISFMSAPRLLVRPVAGVLSPLAALARAMVQIIPALMQATMTSRS